MAPSIADSVREAGIVGAGGAGFPTHVKLAARADTVIANGAECEPLLQCDKDVLRDRGWHVLQGLALLAEATSARRAVLALKGHYRALVEQLREVAAESFPQLEIFTLGNYYPAGDEQVLVNAVTGRIVPEGGIPLAVGAVVNNVITLSQVARAVLEQRPVTSRPLTVAGAVQQPTTCELPIGAPMSAAIAAAGGPTVERWALVEGGPMMGRVLFDAEEPITKRTSGVLVLPDDHQLVRRAQQGIEREVRLARAVCCQCRMCTDLCPRANLGHELRPHLAMRTLTSEGLCAEPPAHVTSAFLCCLCGVCEVYACPLGLSPRRVLDELRQGLLRAEQQNPHRRDDCQPEEFIEQRRVPLARLIARLGLTEYAQAAHVTDWSERAPDAVRIPLSQHTGAAAQPQVIAGERVRRGQLIGEIPQGKLGARVHASIDGTVTAVTEQLICIERS